MIKKYKQKIKRFKKIGYLPKNPLVSVVIVTHKSKTLIESCINSLEKQTIKDFEIIVISNGVNIFNRLKEHHLKYIELRKNYGLSTARNIGIVYSNSRITAFLDDDAICRDDWIDNIVKMFSDKNIVGCRGCILPKTHNNIYNQLAPHYRIENKLVKSILNTEGNCAVLRDILIQAGGFDEKLYGYEGTELSSRILKKNTNKFIVYNPKMIIFHDYASSLFHYLEKQYRYAKNNKIVKFFLSEIEKKTDLRYRNKNIHTPNNFLLTLKIGIILILGKIVKFLGKIPF